MGRGRRNGDGFSIEGNAADITLANNIGANDGVFGGGQNLFGARFVPRPALRLPVAWRLAA